MDSTDLSFEDVEPLLAIDDTWRGEPNLISGIIGVALMQSTDMIMWDWLAYMHLYGQSIASAFAVCY